ncbi:MAG: type II/IV secretion system protein [Candidatus Levyibacteriota bacterium]|nr:MAG: type II/IV secretion system protein [Candidatus Levybacteria bacterium]
MIISDTELKTLIVKTGILDQQKIEDLANLAKNSFSTLGDVLIERDVITDQNLGLLVADYFKLPFIILSNISIPEEVFRIVPQKIARKGKVIAFAREDGGIKIAMSDPRNIEIRDLIAKKTGARVTTYYATERDIDNALRIYRKDLQKAFNDLVKIVGEQFVIEKPDEVPIAKVVDMLVDYAYQDRASDLHIEPKETDSLVRFRIDGILHDMLYFPKNLHERIITRIKILAKLRTDEHLSAQDGKMRILLEEENLDIRVSIIPIVEGEKAVLRLLSSHFRQFSLIDLGMSKEDLKKVTAGFKKSYGMILSTGPTGSGKTTSIYAILKILNTREKNITTVEDPVEYRIAGVNQVQVNTKTDLTFAHGLRSLLRQDPNIIFVGEIRDNETAGIAVNAALTGHLVLSTLHTNDAASAIPRLIDMDVEPFLVASTITLVVAQRLVRKICDMCKTSYIAKKDELEQNIPKNLMQKHFGDKDEIRVYKGQGCKVCHHTGYQGRVGLFEVLGVSKVIRELIAKKSEPDVIMKQADIEGMTTMIEDGLQKVLKGQTTIEEVLRVTKVEMA